MISTAPVAAYETEKKRIAEATIAELDRRWPGFASQVEVVDVPTPATYVRYTGNWQGSPDGWYITPDNMRKRTLLRTLPGLSGLYMVGQWNRTVHRHSIRGDLWPPAHPAVVQAE